MGRIKRAFTLIEVIVIIALIGILAAVAIPNYVKSIDKANERVGIGNLMAMRSGVEFYVINSGGAIPVWGSLAAINAGLGLSLSDASNGGYTCIPVAGVGVNRCRVNLSNGSQLHFHFDGAHHPDGSIHCAAAPCPSCPAQPGECG